MITTKVIPIKDCKQCLFSKDNKCEYYGMEIDLNDEGKHITGTKSQFCRVVAIKVDELNRS